MSDFKCPYCNHAFDHDGDFEGMSCHNEITEWCPECDKAFYSYVDFHPYYSDAREAPCENGEAHEIEKKIAYDDVWRHRCKHCTYEIYQRE